MIARVVVVGVEEDDEEEDDEENNGRILTIESLPLRLPARTWTAPEVDPDVTSQPVEPIKNHHVIYITRIYFVYGASHVELIGAQDFLPDYVNTSYCNCVCAPHPK
ncbi:hypothetical protein HELRODRAFT_170925 [Helobdella robusta]|uniref:Uncharacterized protein n=1 Tax=Helobdella robusta TaxID=6412 RepID=T1F3L6_HELRO|nr:hypothetical protein HELRODRAFT_170925 [Helobdella robusta]ESO06890.1 hypothetical protein HELRODRAFT_170925 [Helobdella robusta]